MSRGKRKAAAASFAAAFAAASLLGGCATAKWEGDYFPSDESSPPVDLGKFRTLEACRQAAQGHLASDPGGRFECGKNCKGGHAGIYFCEEVVR